MGFTRAGVGISTVAVAVAAWLTSGVTPPATPATAAPAVPPAAVRVMPLGDSITWGKGSQAPGFAAYRADLRARLTRAGLTTDFVGSVSNGAPGTDTDHEGHPGWSIAQIARRVDGWLITYRPDVVLLHIGTNDVKKASTAAGATTRLAALVDRIRTRAPGAQIFVAKLTGSTYRGRQARINTYNAAIPGIVSRRGLRVHLVDQSSIRGLNLRDSMHPNDFGYTKMSYNWYRAMRTVFQPAGRRWPAGANPYAATMAYLCVNRPTASCHWWHRRNGHWTIGL